MNRERGGKIHSHAMNEQQMNDAGVCSKPLCQASTLIELTFMEAIEKILDSKFSKIEDRLNDMEGKNDKMYR